jgi:uncharacterized protein YegL
VSFLKKSPRDRPFSSDMKFDHDDRAQRVLITLVLDTSSSMEGEKIMRLNSGLAELADDLRADLELSSKTHVSLITFGHGGVIAWRGQQPAGPSQSAFVPVNALQMPTLRAGGVTPMVEAIELAMQCVANEKRTLKARSLSYYRPLIWLISDGLPTDREGQLSHDWKALPPRLRDEERENHFLFFTVSAGDIDPAGDAILDALAPKAHVRLDTLEFKTALSLVSASADKAQKGKTAEIIQEEIAAVFRQREVLS